jgi:ADP-ribosylglycohydrolase
VVVNAAQVGTLDAMEIELAPRPDLDRARGALLGGACGDALGVPYEFGILHLEPGEEPRMVGGGLGPYAPGEWSDDTQMTSVVARVALELGLDSEAALDAITDGWVGWLSGGATDVGAQTSSVLRRVTPGGGSAERSRTSARALHAETGRSGGNGSLMRTAPVALLPGTLEDVARRARAVSELTHADPVAGDACVIWCAAVHACVWAPEGSYLFDRAQAAVAWALTTTGERRDLWGDWLREADRTPSHDLLHNGYAPVTLQAAWSALLDAERAEGVPQEKTARALITAVHAGNDTDTVAAVTGSLAGALWGASSLPELWASSVHGWPGLRGADLMDLAARLVTKA